MTQQNSQLSHHEENAAHQIARHAAAYVYNGFSRERVAKMIFFATLSMTDSDKGKIVARARALYGKYRAMLRPGFNYVTMSPNGGYTYTNDIIAAANVNAAFRWVMNEVCHAAAENEDVYSEMASDFYSER